MVCLNKVISFEKIKLRNNIKKEIVNKINDDFYLYNEPGLVKLENNIKLELNQIIINKINKLIEKKIDDLFSSDYFIYKNMNDNLCTYKIKKGKSADNFCCKKITKNGNKLKYVCTKHNPDHIPRKRNTKNTQLNVITDISNKPSLKNICNNKSSMLSIKKNNKKKIYKKKNNQPIKIIIRGIIDFKDILNKLMN